MEEESCGQHQHIFLSAEFETFEKVQHAMAAFETDQKITYWRRDTRTFKAAKKHVDVVENSALVYYEIKYGCIKGGREYSAKGSGQRANQR